MSDLESLKTRMRQFTDERDWAQFHDPKSLILALMGEVGELAELFQWLPADQAAELAGAGTLQGRVGEELSDILLYLVRLADILDIELGEAAAAKLDEAERRFSPRVFRGSAPPKS